MDLHKGKERVYSNKWQQFVSQLDWSILARNNIQLAIIKTRVLI